MTTGGYNMHTSTIHPKVFAIVLNYNGKDTLKACLRSLISSDYPNLEVVVVDNDSHDGSIEAVKNQFSRMHYIMLKKNIGFASGNNQGIRFALEKQAKYVFLLNNDARVDKNTISQLVTFSQSNNNTSILSPLIFQDDPQQENIWFCGGEIDWKHMRACHMPCNNAESLPINSFETEYVTGCAMFVPQVIFEKIGLLDERYFLYYEDTDFCVRAAKKGYSSMIVPTAQTYHREVSKDNPDKLYWLVVSGVIFFTSPETAKHRGRTKLYLLARKCKNKLDILRKKNLNTARIIEKAFQDAEQAKTLHNNSEL
jgi:GT2 family glycosyltransferase